MRCVKILVAACLIPALVPAFGSNRTIVVSSSEEVAIFDEIGTSTFRLPDNATGEVRLLVIGGGGAGGANSGGGGGGGQYVYYSNYTLTPGQTYYCTVADGGVSVSNASGSNGGTSTFTDGSSVSVSAIGGGGGAGGWSCIKGKDGANGGGASGQGTGSDTPVLGGQPTVSGGFAGGNKVLGRYYSGGGGGAAGRGCNSNEIPTNGGPGLTNDITGVEVVYCYGGGGGGFSGSGYGGSGTGYGDAGGSATPGEDGTGGGGGGGGYGGSNSGDGGSGIIVIRYQLDTTIPAAKAPTMSRLANGQYRFTVETISGTAQLFAVFTDIVDGSVITNAVTSENVSAGTYQADMSLTADHAFNFAVLMQDGVHTPFMASGEGVIFTGEVSVSKVADAYEKDLVPGSFTVARSSAASAVGFDLTVTYSAGGTAVAGRTYATLSGMVTIPEGESSATIAVTPLDDSETADDPTVVVSLSDGFGFVPAPDASSATLVVYNNSDFTYDAEFGFYPKTVTFTAAVGDPSLGVTWDFGDGSSPETVTESVVTHIYTEPVCATVSMTYNGQTVIKENAITICPPVIYVDSASTNPVSPYHTRATAATKVADAVAAATNGCTILVAPGDYPHGGSSRIVIDKAIRLIGEGESPTNTVLRSTSKRNWFNDGVMTINNADALVANLTLADGWVSNAGWGGNLFINTNGGTVSNCVIRSGSYNHDVQTDAGGAHLVAGLITHTLFENNTNGLDSTGYVRASAAYITSKGRVENCLFRNNRSPTACVVYVEGSQSVLRNCTILDGTVGYYVSSTTTNQLYGVQVNNGTVINCAVADVQTIGYNDIVAGTPSPWGPSTKTAKFTNCATDGTVAPNDTCFLGSSTMFFVSNTTVPRVGGMLYNKGATWNSAPVTDYLGNSRVFGKAIDIGCCESQQRSGFAIFTR